MGSDHFLTIESVQVDSTTGDGNIYGEIMIEFHGLETIYRRSICNAEPSDFLTLTDWWTIYVSLYDGHDIAVGDIHHNTVHQSNLHDRPLQKTLTAAHGQVTVRYNLLYHAVAARIQVAVLGDGEEAARVDNEPARVECADDEKVARVPRVDDDGVARVSRVYGTIKARQYLEKADKWSEVTLFGRSAGESVALLPGGVVPMDRCIVAVPTRAYIRVEVELSLAGDGIGGGDELIASGSVDLEEADGESHCV